MVAHGPSGGSGVVARELAGPLAERGHEVTLFSPSSSRRRLHAGVRLEVVEAPDYPVMPSPAHTVALTNALLNHLQREACDVIHVHYALPLAMAAWSASELSGKRTPFLVTFHGTDVTGIGQSPHYVTALRAACARAAGWSAPSLSLATEAMQVYGVPHVDVTHNFVDHEVYRPVPDSAAARAAAGAAVGLNRRPALQLVHLSNFRPVKRVDRLVGVLQGVRAAGVDAQLALVGDGPTRAPVLEAFAAAGLAESVRWVGDVESTLPWTQAADVLLLPSDRESFGLVALEAMACGKVVIASDVDGLREVIAAPETGFLLDPDDTAAWVRTLVDLASRPTWMKQVGAAARARAVAEFSPAQMCERYLRWYGRTLESV